MIKPAGPNRYPRLSKPTIRDVARSAQVSAATISRVINHPELVSEEVTKKVRAAIAQAGYVPNASARALAIRATRTIGAVMPTISSPIYSKIISATQHELEQRGFVLFLADFQYSLERELQSAQALVERGVDGLVLVGSSHDPRLFELIGRTQLPVVLTCIYEPTSALPTIGWDNKAGGIRMARYMVKLGHREFGIIGGIQANNDRAAARVTGFIEGLAESDIRVPRKQILQCRYDLIDSGNALRQLMDVPTPPTAILCGNDVLATGALLECLKQGIRVPADLSISGYDDQDLSARLVPSLTTLRIPTDRIGQLAVDTLIGLLGGAPVMRHVDLGLELVVRETTAALPFGGSLAP